MTKYRTGNCGRNKIYHTDLDCYQIDAENAREISDHFVEWHDMTECEWCAGTVVIHNEGDTNNDQVSQS